MRTNIEIDDELMAQALKMSGLKTKKAVVEEGLRLLVGLRGQASVADLYGKIPWEGDLEAWRLDDVGEDKR
ncbi:MAG TPA: type II toxin-antitoxin system VapB family antitoxin [Geminicoccaceae bacterium]|nr:type II toxin-antitoxin system VapB family antitoxin [Geminicoccus sp.]HMU51374.1 type II toxin-antitoxin system VapB family antitoxin [Geminicoccaceae bacterium]